VRISSGHRTSRSIHHVVTAIVAPFGRPVNERPPVLTIEQLASLRLKTRLEKDVRSAERGRLTSKWRLKEAQKAGHAIPDLETAMRGVRLEEERRAEGGEAHRGQAGQAVTSKERRRVERVKTKEEVKAEAKVKRAKAQTQPKTAIPA
jgi:small subunit ribosomal protein S17